jgi:ComF family protein
VSGSWLQKINQNLLDLLLPPRCVHCKASNSWFCNNCVAQTAFISTKVCHRCGTPIATEFSPCNQCAVNPLHAIDGIRSASFFDNNPIRSAIHALKYNNHKAVAQPLAKILANTVRQYNLIADEIVPIPLHPSRQKERGYNQSELLAQHLGQILALPVNTTTLKRIKKTETQMTLGALARKTNVKNAFDCNNNQLTHKHLLLIDDVCTTGSTLDACAETLKAHGTVSVWGLTLAKAQ